MTQPIQTRSPERLRQLLAVGEGIDQEFKTCRERLPRNIYETICAFLNRHGGTLWLGVADDGSISGVNPDSVATIRKDLVSAINNPQKLSPPTYLSIETLTDGNKTLLRVYVPEGSQVHRCNGRIYDRNEDGDFDITDQTTPVAKLYQRKQATYSENKVYPWIQPDDLRDDLIEKCRKYLRINRENHPWTEMDDAELLQSAQLLQTDSESGKPGITLAGVMLFGTDILIRQVCPAHRTDLILRKVDVDRYDDRDLVITNLIESYDRILAFIQKHLPDPFYLEGIERRSLRDHIFREVASNMLIHREYSSGATSRIIIEYGRVVTDNPSRPHGFGRLDPVSSVPFQKNPILSAFFREIDRADELGSGMRKMMLYGKKFGGADPQLIEGDNFRMIISVPEFGENPAQSAKILPKTHSTPQVTPQVIPQVIPQVTPQVKNLLIALLNGEKTREELQEQIDIRDREHFRKAYLEPLLHTDWIERTLPDKPTSRLQKYRLTEKGRHQVDRS